MAGGPPSLQVGAQGSLGVAKQSVFGTPVTTPANAKNWIDFTVIDLNFDPAWRGIATGSGNRASMRHAARGTSLTKGGFTNLLQPTMGAALLAYFFGQDSYATGTHTISVAPPQLLTIEKLMASQSLQYQDVLLDQLDLGQSGGEWTCKWVTMGGIGDAAIASGTPTYPADSSVFTWGDTTMSGLFGGLTAAEVSAVGLSFRNGVRQFPGAGSYAPTRAAGGAFSATGQLTALYDSAASAAADAAELAGTEYTVVVTLTKDGTHNLVITLPNSHITASLPQQPLADLITVQYSWFVRKADLITLALQNDDASSY